MAHEPPFDPALPRCWWSGATSDRADPAMVRYHDEEWGTPCHDDIELFERLALESFPAGRSWATVRGPLSLSCSRTARRVCGF